MCGICGFINFDTAPIPSEILQRMTASLVHRGPDGEGTYFRPASGENRPGIGLGHRRLAIIDLSANASQPMTNENESLWIVFNGEIYNFRELRTTLQAQGHIFRSNSDTEVVLRLYEEFGEKCVEKLDGMFAFALWDERRRRLFLARDRVGKKPLYYASAQGAFVFGSEVKAAVRHPAVYGAISLESLPHYFTFGYPPPGQTFYRGIRQLAPAHSMTVEADGRIEVRRYWDLDYSGVQRRVRLPDAVAQVRTLVTEAVRKRLVADVPLGAFLSGGLDSSIVVGVMSRLMEKPVKTFSLGFAGDPAFDETRYARLVASHFQTDHTEFIVEPKAIDLIELLVRHHDGPFGDSSAIPTYIVSQLTRHHVKVALNGDGGDELFAGYLRFQACLLADKLNPAFCRLYNRVLAVLPQPRSYHHWLRRGQRFFAAASSPSLERLRRWISIFDEDLPKLLRPEVFKEISHAGIGYPPELLARTGSVSPLSKILYVNFMTYLPDDLLVKMDRCTMAHGLEGRSPLLDHTLAEYVAGLPDTFKLHGGTTKYILRAAFGDLLPRAVLRRGKKGFGVPLGAWFRNDLRDYVQDMLLSPTALSREYLMPAYVSDIVREHTSGLRDHGNRLWTLLAFEVWLQRMRDQGMHQH
ncbi:MAG: asparagine synthase (glutamine-hydrolyzing) [Desulfobacteraceae bacterium]|nr:MAG: asparagine synthase (glutamine-hydrolyzing) [Desulfobacteraceae bacterium]